MTGKSYELPEVITILGGIVTWVDEDSVWHTEIFERRGRARCVRGARPRRRPSLHGAPGAAHQPAGARLLGGTGRCATDAGPLAARRRVLRMTRALLASAVVMDAAGWACTAQGAYGLARVCFSAALPFIAAWALASLFD